MGLWEEPYFDLDTNFEPLLKFVNENWEGNFNSDAPVSEPVVDPVQVQLPSKNRLDREETIGNVDVRNEPRLTCRTTFAVLKGNNIETDTKLTMVLHLQYIC